MVQNKLHYAAHGHTAAEVIFERADAEKPFMGLTAFSGDFPTAKDIAVAKNYLSADELKILNAMAGEGADFCDFSRYFQRLKLQHAQLYGPNKNRARIQKLSGTSASLLIDA